MNIEERIKNHLQQLAPHVAHRETATLLTLCLGELKLAKDDMKTLSIKYSDLALKNERLEIDAARYKKLRSNDWVNHGIVVANSEQLRIGDEVYTQGRLDDAVDGLPIEE